MKVKLEIKMPSDSEINRIFATAPVLDRYKVLDKAARAVARPLQQAIKKNTPRSSVTGSAKKRSKKQQAEANWSVPLWTTMTTQVRKFDKGVFLIVGPKWPQGSKVYFNAVVKKGSRAEVFWGRRKGTQYIPLDNWVQRSADETESQRKAIFKSSLKKSLDEMMP